MENWKNKIQVVFFFIIYLFLNTGASSAQNPNIDFSELNFNNWNPTIGYRGNCCNTQGIQMLSHTIITNPINDGLVPSIPRIPSGLTQTARLGDPAGGPDPVTGIGKAWRMDYTATITADNPLLHYQIAIILDGTHNTLMSEGMNRNSVFTAKITDQSGQVINGSCGNYQVHKYTGNMQNGISNIVYLPWNSVGMDLTPYIGQTVNIEFTVYSCYYGGHHGNSYAYISADVITKTDTVYFCKDALETTVEGLPRFASYNWSNGATTQNATISNPVDGTSYTCTYTSFNGCVMQRTYILKENPIQAAFSYTPGGCNEITFTDETQSPFPPVNWQWTFGDASNTPNDTSDVQNPAYTYSDTGYYNVNFIVQDGMGCYDTLTQQVSVSSAGSGDFSFNAPCEGNPVQFTDLSSGTIVSHQWDFGNGNASVEADPVHTYNSAGVYTVTLITENVSGCMDTIVKQITVNQNPVASFILPGEVCEQEIIALSNTSSNALSYNWEFGNGEQSTEENPEYAYATQGTYTITLVAAHSNGCSDTAQQTVSINPNPVAGFEATPTETSINNPQITFNNQSTGAASWLWDFADGNKSTEEHPVHTYTQSGDYEVVLVAYNQYQCADTATATIIIFDEIIVPNVFTPNGDGINDQFYVVANPNMVLSIELIIVNRWGNEVFRTDKLPEVWNGNINGEPATDGVYFYTVKLTTTKGENKEYTGFLHLSR